MKMKIINYVILCLIVLCIPLFFITSNIGFLSNNLSIYGYSIDKYNIEKVTGIDKMELLRTYQQWIDYYNSKVDSPQISVNKINGGKIDLLSQKEIIHLQDVKKLINLDYIVQVTSFILIVISLLLWIFINKRDGWQMWLRGILWGSIISIGLVAILIIGSACCFDQLFILFHLVSFSNSFWILDPARDYLIMMFPEGFFYDIAIIGSMMIIIESAILGIISFTILKLKKKAAPVQA